MLRMTLAALAILAGNSVSAATMTLMSGDDDCFGVNDPCGAGDILAVGSSFDNATASDPAGQDVFGELGTTSFSFALDSLALNNALSATFSIKVLGLDLVDTGTAIGDAFEGTRILLNGNDIGIYNQTNAPTEVDVISFAIAASSLTATNVFSIVPEEAFEPASIFENYAVDFAKLAVELDMSGPPMGAVPLPASGLLLLGGLGAVAGLRRRKSAAS